MSRRIANLAFAAALGLTVTVGLSGVAQAGPSTVCGNGTTEDPPEKCDDGNTVSNDGCSFPSCLPEVCGDNITNPDIGETCDDGNTAPNDGCDATCHLECGNGTIEGAEQCDTSGESATCDDDCTDVSCGDSNINQAAGEQCDPPGAACSDTCQDTGGPQTKQQQTCINGINGNTLGVLKAQNKNSSTCVKNVAAGKLTVDQCIGIDVGGKIAKAEAKTSKTDLSKCATPNTPTIAYTSANTANTGAKTGALGTAVAIFGVAPTIADKKTDKAGAGCQAEVVKRSIKLQETWLAEANKEKKTALKGSKTTPGVATDSALATAIDAAVANSTKITKAENGVNSGLAKKCTDAQVDPLFDCDGATTTNALALCVIEQAKRGACLALEAADGLALNCPGDV